MAQRSERLWDDSRMVAEQLLHQMEKVMVGKRDSMVQLLTALFAGGHVLLEDVPGVGKTMLVKTMAKVVDCTFKRIQFTPDMLPSDVTGSSVYNPKTGSFEFRPGPVMAHIVLADELNRASPKTQSALLEAMEERQVTSDGETRKLERPFLVLATQNPVDFEGTYGLPEAQLDRFMMTVRLGYPSAEEESMLLSRMQEGEPLTEVKPVLLKEEVQALQEQVRTVHVDDSIRAYIVGLAHATRKHPDVRLGASPRASLALMRAGQAAAFVRGRTYVIPDDVKGMLLPVFSHRLLLEPEAKWKCGSADPILRQISEQVAPPAAGNGYGPGGFGRSTADKSNAALRTGSPYPGERS